MKTEPEKDLSLFLGALAESGVTFFPVRHHSPACSWHLREIIRREKFDAILIEGAEDITNLIPFILDENTRAPFAVYTTFIAEKKEESALPPRFAAYYPFCDYSPELIALREGSKIGAKLKFIDLTFPEQVIHETADSQHEKPRSLLDESYLQHSEYLNALAKKCGARDTDELWDTLFEADFWQISSAEFINRVAAYCFLARYNYREETLVRDGTLAREAAMAAAIVEELKNGEQKILVVTGGFHTAVLPFLIEQKPERPKRFQPSEKDAQTVMLRYSFDQLDSLNGYASGMPSPHFYQQFWENLDKFDSPVGAAKETATQILIEVGRMTREKDLQNQLSTADEIAALAQTLRLAEFRGHASFPTREDLLDGVRSCFVKGGMDAEGAILLEIVLRTLAGSRIGEIPANSSVPPIVEDFRSNCLRFKLNITDSTPKKLSLDLYRQENHRRLSRFLHGLNLLGVYFATATASPDFARGLRLELRHEQWEYRWTPLTESRLVECSVYGATIEEAVLARVQERIEHLESEGKANSASEAVKILILACQVGLQEQIGAKLASLIERKIAADASFASIAEAVSQLRLLWSAREPLAASELSAIPELMNTGYLRACFILPDIVNAPESEFRQMVESLCVMRELLVSENVEFFDAEIFYDALEDVIYSPTCPPLIAGAVYGLLQNTGRIASETLLRQTEANLLTGNKNSISFLSGLLRTAREIAWTEPEFLQLLDRYLRDWTEEEFLQLLPEMRLAFSYLTPRETDRVAQTVADMYSEKSIGRTFFGNLSEEDLLLGLEINKLTVESLERDGLTDWI
ncbi:MAG TPA: DUF5682 family protein [Pyrinomonadaceae bacterium]